VPSLSLTIVHLSDCHLFANTEQCGNGAINPYISLQSVLAKIAVLQADLVIASGDISGDESVHSYQHFQQLWRESTIRAPLMVLPGNHDNECLLADVLSKEYNWPTSLSLAPHWQVHGLNSKATGTQGSVSDQQLSTLAQQLKAHPDIYHLIAVHHHPIACGGWMDAHSWHNREGFMDLVACHPQVKAVVYGHIHHASEQMRQDCRFLSVPSTCWQWANQAEFACSGESPGYRVLTLYPDGQLSSQVERI
jgi:Icc protein